MDDSVEPDEESSLLESSMVADEVLSLEEEEPPAKRRKRAEGEDEIVYNVLTGCNPRPLRYVFKHPDFANPDEEVLFWLGKRKRLGRRPLRRTQGNGGSSDETADKREGDGDVVMDEIGDGEEGVGDSQGGQPRVAERATSKDMQEEPAVTSAQEGVELEAENSATEKDKVADKEVEKAVGDAMEVDEAVPEKAEPEAETAVALADEEIDGLLDFGLETLGEVLDLPAAHVSSSSSGSDELPGWDVDEEVDGASDVSDDDMDAIEEGDSGLESEDDDEETEASDEEEEEMAEEGLEEEEGESEEEEEEEEEEPSDDDANDDDPCIEISEKELEEEEGIAFQMNNYESYYHQPQPLVALDMPLSEQLEVYEEVACLTKYSSYRDRRTAYEFLEAHMDATGVSELKVLDVPAISRLQWYMLGVFGVRTLDVSSTTFNRKDTPRPPWCNMEVPVLKELSACVRNFVQEAVELAYAFARERKKNSKVSIYPNLERLGIRDPNSVSVSEADVLAAITHHPMMRMQRFVPPPPPPPDPSDFIPHSPDIDDDDIWFPHQQTGDTENTTP